MKTTYLKSSASYIAIFALAGSFVFVGTQVKARSGTLETDPRRVAEGARESGNENTAEQIDRGGDSRSVAEGAREDGSENTAEQIDRGADPRDIAEGAREDGDEDAAEAIGG